jgi:SHS2 domain-containing protein
LEFGIWDLEMGFFTLLDHPSDIGIEATGSTLSEAFSSAASGLVSIIIDPATICSDESREIEIEADDDEMLLVKWLNEFIYLFDARHFVCARIDIHELKEHRLKASVRGEPFSANRHTARTDVKAVTFHQLSIGENNGVWTVRVFVDL